MSPSGIEVAWVTPAELLGAFVIWLVVSLAAAGLGWWLRGADPPAPSEVEPVEDPDAAVEAKSRRRRPPNTGTIHAAHLPVPDDSPTQVIRRPGAQS